MMWWSKVYIFLLSWLGMHVTWPPRTNVYCTKFIGHAKFFRSILESGFSQNVRPNTYVWFLHTFPSSCKRYTPYYTSFRIIMCLWGNPTSHIRCISSDCTFWERNCIIFVTKLSNIFYSHLKSQFIAFASFSRKVIFQGLTIVNELTSTF